MSRAMITESYLSGIANAIRTKNGSSDEYTPAQMAVAIGQIHGNPVNQEKTVTQNGEVTPDSGYDGLSKVTVNVPGATLVSKSITANGSYNPASDSADGYSSVNVNVPNSYVAGDEGKVVSGGALVAQTARASTITENGQYDTTNNNSVTVNVSGGESGVSVPADYSGLSYAYIATTGGFNWQTTRNTYLCLFPVVAGKTYAIFVGETVSNRLRIHFYAGKSYSDFSSYVENQPQSTQTNIYTCTANITGTSELSGNRLKERCFYTPQADGEIIVDTSSDSVVAPAFCIKLS